MADEKPRVSVVMPTFNRLSYRREASASVVAPAHAWWGVLAVDDGFTDGSTEYGASLSDRRIRCGRQAHAGTPSPARHPGSPRCVEPSP